MFFHMLKMAYNTEPTVFDYRQIHNGLLDDLKQMEKSLSSQSVLYREHSSWTTVSTTLASTMQYSDSTIVTIG